MIAALQIIGRHLAELSEMNKNMDLVAKIRAAQTVVADEIKRLLKDDINSDLKVALLACSKLLRYGGYTFIEREAAVGLAEKALRRAGHEFH